MKHAERALGPDPHRSWGGLAERPGQQGVTASWSEDKQSVRELPAVWHPRLMKVFVSHATEDHPLAEYLAVAFRQVGVDSFVLPDDAPLGSSWMESIRAGLGACDEGVFILTPRSVSRPWIAAEWACFWSMDKRSSPLMLGVTPGDIWEPMRTYQGAALNAPERISSLLKRWSELTGEQPAAGVVPLAQQIAQQCTEINARVRRDIAGAIIERVAKNIRPGTGNISGQDVSDLVDEERVTDLVDIATSQVATSVKQRQIATGLVLAGRHGEALRIARAIENRAEARNVATAVVDTMDITAIPESEEWTFLIGIFDHLRSPQRRDIHARMLARGIVPIGPWE